MFSLWTSVEDHVLEFVGLESGSGLIVWDFRESGSSLNRSCAARCSAPIPPPFSRQDSLSGVDTGRGRLIRAQSGFRW